MKTMHEDPKGTSAAVTDGRGALPKPWLVAYTRVNYERKAEAALKALGYEVYRPVQREWHRWSDRRKLVERVVIPMLLFVRTDPRGADAVVRLSFITHFLRVPGMARLAEVPDCQVSSFRFLLENAPSSVLLEPSDIKKGDKVKVRCGKLKGLVGYVRHSRDGGAKITITIDNLGCASVSVDIGDLMLA